MFLCLTIIKWLLSSMFYIAVLCKMHVMLCWAAFQIQLQSRIFPTSSVETPRVWSCCQCGHHRTNGITFHLLYDFLEHFVFPVWMCRSSQAFMFLKESICHWCWKILQRIWNGNMTFSFSTEDFAPLSSPWCYFVREIYWLSFLFFIWKAETKIWSLVHCQVSTVAGTDPGQWGTRN